MVEPHSSNFRVITTIFLGVQIFRKFTVLRVTECDIILLITKYSVGRKQLLANEKPNVYGYKDNIIKKKARAHVNVNFGTKANSVDSDQVPQNALSDQDLHYLLTGICIRNLIKYKSTPYTPKIGNGLVQSIRMEESTKQIWVKCFVSGYA